MATQDLESTIEPLNSRQLAFARELGVARAKGGRDEDLTRAYEAAGYSPDRGNARRLAADPRIRKIADEACAEALERAGLHIQYLQAKALEMLHLSPAKVHMAISKCLGDDGNWRKDLTADEIAELNAATWALSKLKVGDLTVELPDGKGLIEMLAKQLGAGTDHNQVNVGITLESLVGASMKKPEAA